MSPTGKAVKTMSVPARAVLVTLLFGAVACTATAPDPGPRFDDETANGVVTELSCMKHQPQPPGPRYHDDKLRRTDETLTLLRYYTANGGKPYCDGQRFTETDRQWVALYVRLGADRKNVAALLGEG
ncbi:hypothetical protein SAMN05421504_101807 [Amycolatopsis xylanica]|uniref:Lipoprotein n=1 Tax=Amycolatopsis xylanica TaxID=589385 RepID=A0A1H2U7E3_9PSEU|nr:hypothetical protein [Amycolatopsis xylanica]SDW52066.1 hypothetical protein SAMN05421504_101807 [Amycolatopsis xylanica]